MNGARKVLLGLFAVVLLGSLLGTALATSTKYTVYNPKNIEKWLSESKIYDHFVTNAVEQGQKSVGSVQDTDVTSLSDTAVQDAAKSAFSQQLVQTNINKFIESNYAWLEGKTKTPEFSIDLTGAKQSFAEQVGSYTTTHLASLPVCTNAQLAQIQTIDPLSITCRPSNVDPNAEGAKVTQQIAASDELLANPVLTAQNINPDPASQITEPYYEKLSQLPRAYQFGQKLPYFFAGLAFLSAIVLVLLTRVRRKGLKAVGIIFAIAGALLIIAKFTSDTAYKQLEDRIFNTSQTGELQRSLTSFVLQIEQASTQIQFIFGIAFLVVALIILIIVRMTRNKVITVPTPTILNDLTPINDTPQKKPATARIKSSGSASAKKPTTSRPKKRPPRLVQ